jgi:hypothetical protein
MSARYTLHGASATPAALVAAIVTERYLISESFSIPAAIA